MKPLLCLLLSVCACLVQAGEAEDNDLFSEGEKAQLVEPEESDTLELEGGENEALFAKASEEKQAFPLTLGGFGALEYRFFHDHGLDRGMDYHNNVSFYLEPEFSYRRGRHHFAFKPFWRYDQHDNRRTHFDIRELVWYANWKRWTLHAGIDKVFWGVTESRHTVDIINQTDLVENIDTEQKLGQPMLRLDYGDPKWGTWSAFYLPVFRKRLFPGKEGRFRPPLPITASVDYEGNAGPTHPDFALRWARTFGYWDVGLVYFRGVTRRPRFRIRFDPFGRPVDLRPVYEIIDQVSLDIQGVTGNWLWKFEGFHRAGQGRTFQQLTAGFEYTFSGVFGTGTDLGFLWEFLYDNRSNRFPMINFVPFEKDIFVGTRLALNDVQSTELLATATIDLDTATTFYNIEASRRLGKRWKLYLEIRGFVNTDPKDAGYVLRKENYIHLECQYYF